MKPIWDIIDGPHGNLVCLALVVIVACVVFGLHARSQRRAS